MKNVIISAIAAILIVIICVFFFRRGMEEARNTNENSMINGLEK